MGYTTQKIDSVKAIHIPDRIKKGEIEKFGISEEDFEDLMRFKKADAQLRIVITVGNLLRIENLSLKKANSDADYNQIIRQINDGLMHIKECAF
ncbi:MAG: hypothetical protein B6U72_02380 [Candidatus Altiarchaeales archaeon ex4484_2]|nr:MAG: hypothetical protein B6U72_02380 [Candidatus Altiarchaeales archaeon ex4484_2]